MRATTFILKQIMIEMMMMVMMMVMVVIKVRDTAIKKGGL